MRPVLYEIDDRLYLALTNRCPTSCTFCPKGPWEMTFRGADLRVEREPSADEMIAAVDERVARGGISEVVFCGYGECTYRLEAVSSIGLFLRLHRRGTKVRLNTIGLGSLIWGRDIARLLSLCLDEVSVSLNTADPLQWDELHRPRPEYRGLGFAAATVFASRCVEVGLKTTVTAIDLPGVDVSAVCALAGWLGAGFRERPRLL